MKIAISTKWYQVPACQAVLSGCDAILCCNHLELESLQNMFGPDRVVFAANLPPGPHRYVTELDLVRALRDQLAAGDRRARAVFSQIRTLDLGIQVLGFPARSFWSYDGVTFAVTEQPGEVPDLAIRFAIQHLDRFLTSVQPEPASGQESDQSYIQQRVRKLLSGYASTTNQVDYEDDVLVTDVLTDMMHYCRGNEINFDNCLRIAGGHFEKERG